MPFAQVGGRGRFLLVLFLAGFSALLVGAAVAQDASTPSEEAVTEATPEAGDSASEGRAPAEPPAFPPGLDDPKLSLAELRARLLPLTAEELAALASAWQGIAREATQDAVDAQIEHRVAGDAATDAMTQRIEDLIAVRGEVFDRFGAVVTSLEIKGGDPAVVESLRAYRTAITVEETQAMNAGELAQRALDWLTSPEGGGEFAVRVGVILAAFLGLVIAARIVRRWARHLFERIPNLSKLLVGFLTMVVYWLTIAVGLMVVLAALGVNITPLFALLGGASFIMAFALQDTLGNLAAGLMIMINRPFDVGDYVTVAGVGGTVKDVSVVSTTVTTPDNQVIVIPNAKVWGDVITNVTASETRRVDLVFGIGYDDSIEEAQTTLEEVVAAHPAVMSDPAPVIRVNALSDSSVDFVVRPWVKASDYWTVYWDLTRQVKEAFDAKGLTIPYPQTEMTIRHGASLDERA